MEETGLKQFYTSILPVQVVELRGELGRTRGLVEHLAREAEGGQVARASPSTHHRDV